MHRYHVKSRIRVANACISIRKWRALPTAAVIACARHISAAKRHALVNRGCTDSLSKQLIAETRAIARILCRGPGQARFPLVSLPLRMRGDGAPGGAAVSR